MKTPLVYGLGMALASAAFVLLLHILGITTEPGRILLPLLLGLPIALAIVVLGIVLGTRRARREAGAAGFSYGRAFTTGFLITLVAALAGAAFNAIYYTFIFPDFVDVAVETTRSMLERFGARDADIEKAVEDIRAKSTVTRQVVSGFIGGLVMGTIVSLITAAVMKRAPADEVVPAPPRV